MLCFAGVIYSRREDLNEERQAWSYPTVAVYHSRHKPIILTALSSSHRQLNKQLRDTHIHHRRFPDRKSSPDLDEQIILQTTMAQYWADSTVLFHQSQVLKVNKGMTLLKTASLHNTAIFNSDYSKALG